MRGRLFGLYLRSWARLVLRSQKPYVIAVTGSVGKSSTTHLLASLLARTNVGGPAKFVAGTTNNLNDDQGVPLMVLRHETWPVSFGQRLWVTLATPFRATALALSHRYPSFLVVECAAAPTSNLTRIARLLRPAVTVVTTIDAVHLDRFKTLEGIAAEKAALVQVVPPTGLVVLGDGHSQVNCLKRLSKAPVAMASGRGTDRTRTIARVVGNHLGIATERVEAIVGSIPSLPQRLARTECQRFTVIDDTYNASLPSVKLALDTLAEAAEPGRRRVAVLGALVYQGDQEMEVHEEIRDYARQRADFTVGVGALARLYQPDLWFDDVARCADAATTFVREGDVILVKGPGLLFMARIVERLVAAERWTVQR